MNTPVKRCTRGNNCQCPLGAEQPATTEHFHRHKGRADGFSSCCKTCEKTDREPKREQRAANTRRWQAANSERDKARKQQWRKDNPDKKSEYNRRFLENHPEKRGERHLYMKQWQADNRDEVNAKARRRWKERYAEKYKPLRQCWRKNNAIKMRVYCRNYQARKRSTSGAYTPSDISRQLTLQEGKCFWCSCALGNSYHIDHVIPLSRGGTNAPDNLACTCPTCNLSKNAKLAFSEWIPPNPLLVDPCLKIDK